SNRTPAKFSYDNLKNGCKALTEEQVQYLRGDPSLEFSSGGAFRSRHGKLLGDIVHSNPVVVGEPDRLRYPRKWLDKRYPEQAMPENDAPAYSSPLAATTAFAQNSSRTPVVYVGANDGMLHGFDADTGEEVLAYIP